MNGYAITLEEGVNKQNFLWLTNTSSRRRIKIVLCTLDIKLMKEFLKEGEEHGI